MPGQTGYDYFLENALKYGWMIPPGLIGIWRSTIATIPAGWVFCDGNNGTPDMRNVLIAGAQEDDGGVAKTNISGSLTQSGGALGHTHSFTAGGHVHDFTGDGHAHANQDSAQMTDGSGSYAWDADYGETSIVAAAGTTDSAQSSGTTDNQNVLPPYKAGVWMMKT